MASGFSSPWSLNCGGFVPTRELGCDLLLRLRSAAFRCGFSRSAVDLRVLTGGSSHHAHHRILRFSSLTRSSPHHHGHHPASFRGSLRLFSRDKSSVNALESITCSGCRRGEYGRHPRQQGLVVWAVPRLIEPERLEQTLSLLAVVIFQVGKDRHSPAQKRLAILAVDRGGREMPHGGLIIDQCHTDPLQVSDVPGPDRSIIPALGRRGRFWE